MSEDTAYLYRVEIERLRDEKTQHQKESEHHQAKFNDLHKEYERVKKENSVLIPISATVCALWVLLVLELIVDFL